MEWGPLMQHQNIPQAAELPVRQKGGNPLRAAADWLGNTLPALRYRNFRLYWIGQLVSLIGTWMQTMAQGWLVYDLTRSPLMLGFVGFMASLPILVTALFAGVIVDRVSKRSLLVVTQTLAMLQAAALGLLTVTGQVQVWHVLIAALVLGTVNAFDMPGRQSFVIEMVDGKENLLNAVALNSSIFNGARIIGPSMAGILVAIPFIGIGGVFLLNAVSFLAVIVGLLMMRLPPWVPPKNPSSVLHSVVEGLSYLRANPTVFTLVSLIGIVSIFGMPYATLMPAFARDVLQVGAQEYGLLMGSVGVGAVAGAMVLAILGNFRHKGWLLTAGNLGFPLMLLVLATTRSYELAIAALILAGLSMASQNTIANTLLQTTTPDRLRGRVMSFYTLMLVGVTPLGNLQAGAIANYCGIPAAIAIGAIIAIAYALWVLWRRPEVQRLE
jgi:MFS family permease